MDAPFEIVDPPSSGGPFVFTCEHASNALPGRSPDAADRDLLEAHWGYDIGAANLTRALAEATGSGAVLSRFSRLLCDPNRDPSEPSFVVREVEGRAVAMNRNVDAAEIARRRGELFDPYHAAVDRTVRRRAAVDANFRLCSIHSFAPVFAGEARTMEIGVLYDAHEDAARSLEQRLAREGFTTALNQPYSGFEGLVYAVQRHGRAHDRVYVELEVRHDLIDTELRAYAMAERIASALALWGG